MKTNITNSLILITLASSLLYVLFNNLPIVLGSFTFFWAPLTLIFIIISKPIIILEKPLSYIFIYGFLTIAFLMNILWIYMDQWNRNNIYNDFYALIIFTTIYTFLTKNNNYYVFSKIGKYSTIFIIVNLVMTNIVLFIDPMIIRDSAGLEFGGVTKILFARLGSGDYNFMHLLVCLIPVIVYFIKNESKPILGKWMLISLLIVIIITEIRAQIFANILVSILVLIVSLLGYYRRNNIFLISIAILIIATIFPIAEIFETFISHITQYVNPGSDLYLKLNDFANFILNPELNEDTGTGGRAERYPLLFQAFLDNPFFGNSAYESSHDISLGGHLYWMNKLALWGLSGFALFVFIIYKLLKTIYSKFNHIFKYYYLLSIISFIVLGLMKQITGREPWLVMILIIPGLYNWQNLRNKS